MTFEEVIDISYFYSKYIIFSQTRTFKILEGQFLPQKPAGGRRNPQRVLVLILRTTRNKNLLWLLDVSMILASVCQNKFFPESVQKSP